MDVAQAGPFASAAAYDAGPEAYEELPYTQKPVNILGTSYSAIHEREDIKHDILSRLWFTYRRSFAPIGGEGPTSDAGWGCMLRCGQMMLAHAFVILHLGREWRWYRGKNNPLYYEILKRFLDNKSAPYSIHQITNMGASEGKPVGEWLGPNTIAQVLKKLVFYDSWTKLVIHVALDNTVVKEDLRQYGGSVCEKATPAMPDDEACQVDHGIKEFSFHDELGFCSDELLLNKPPKKVVADTDRSDSGRGATSVVSGATERADDTTPQGAETCGDGVDAKHSANVQAAPTEWHPILLVIPLRLGLSEINPVYFNAIKRCFAFPQCVGIIGGRPNQAHWFIGTLDDDLIFLDPHTNQPHEDISDSRFTDESFHCSFVCRMPIDRLDPSMAIGFLCTSEDDLEDCLRSLRIFILLNAKCPMFEIYDKRPEHWPPFERYTPQATNISDYEDVEPQYDTDEEFELL